MNAGKICKIGQNPSSGDCVWWRWERVWGWILHTEGPAAYEPLWYCTGSLWPVKNQWIETRTWGVTEFNKDKWKETWIWAKGKNRSVTCETMVLLAFIHSKAGEFWVSILGKLGWTFCHLGSLFLCTWPSSLSSSCCSLLIWEHQFSSSSSSSSVLTSANTIIWVVLSLCTVSHWRLGLGYYVLVMLSPTTPLASM